MTPVRAAGGVVWRPGPPGVDPPTGSVEVCLVHRPRYDDWSLPKGKLDPGEHPLLAAVREVAEEADVRAVPQVRLPEARYFSLGRPKVVDYWSMAAVGDGGFQPQTEVDEVRWLPVGAAVDLVTYPHDARVLRAFAALPPVTSVQALVRHASAHRRGAWTGPDTARPLDAAGWAQARAVAPLLAVVRPQRLVSASALRCVQTLDPLAELLDLPIEVDSCFDEPKPGQDVEENALSAAARLVELTATGVRVAICSQGKVMPQALDRLGPAGDDHATGKGAGWLLAYSGQRLVAADRLTPV
ncbi:NUDIX hydrolase [Micromonospora zhanjiangensis]